MGLVVAYCWAAGVTLHAGEMCFGDASLRTSGYEVLCSTSGAIDRYSTL